MQTHYTDAELLEFLDGEIGHITRWRLQLHLFRCWECRGRKADLEKQAHRFAQALRADNFPGPDRLQEARARFERWTRMEEVGAAAAASGTWSARKRIAWCAFGFAAVACVFASQYALRPAAMLTITPAKVRPSAVMSVPGKAASPAHFPSPPVSPAPPRVARASRKQHSNDDIDLIEADVHYRLHRIGACAAEPVLITRAAGGRLLVTAVSPPASRRHEIEKALADLERDGIVKFNVTGDAPEPIRLEAIGDVSQGALSTGRLADSPLAQSFPNQAELVERAGRIMRQAEGLYAEAWALHRHRSLVLDSNSSRSPARWLAEAMRRDHSIQLLSKLGSLEESLEPFGLAAAGNCDATVKDIFETSGKLTALIHRLFSPATSEELATVDQDKQLLSAVVTDLRCTLK